jgi:hypothetical protein
MKNMTKSRCLPDQRTIRKSIKQNSQRPNNGVDDSTNAIRAAQDRAMESVKWLLARADACKCARCVATNHRAHARGLVDVVIESMEYLGQRNTSRYMEALRLRANCGTGYPACHSGSGFATVPPRETATPGPCRQAIVRI